MPAEHALVGNWFRYEANKSETALNFSGIWNGSSTVSTTVKTKDPATAIVSSAVLRDN